MAAMTSERKYSDILPYEQALEEIKQGAGTQFDPDLVEIFLRLAKVTISHYPETETEYEEVKSLEEK